MGLFSNANTVIRPTGTRSDKWDIDYDEVYQTGTIFTAAPLENSASEPNPNDYGTISYGTRDCYHILKVKKHKIKQETGVIMQSVRYLLILMVLNSDTPQLSCLL